MLAHIKLLVVIVKYAQQDRFALMNLALLSSVQLVNTVQQGLVHPKNALKTQRVLMMELRLHA